MKAPKALTSSASAEEREAHHNETVLAATNVFIVPPKNVTQNALERAESMIKTLIRGGLQDVSEALALAGVDKTGTSDRSYVLSNLLMSRSDKKRAYISRLQSTIGEPVDSAISELYADLKQSKGLAELTPSELSLDVGEIYTLLHLQEVIEYYKAAKVNTANLLSEESTKDPDNAKSLTDLKQRLARQTRLSNVAGGLTALEIQNKRNEFEKKYGDLALFESPTSAIAKANKALLDIRLKNKLITNAQYDLVTTANYKYYTPFLPDNGINAALKSFSIDGLVQVEGALRGNRDAGFRTDIIEDGVRTGKEVAGNAYTNLTISLERVASSIINDPINAEFINLFNKGYSAPDAKGVATRLVDRLNTSGKVSLDDQLNKIANRLNTTPDQLIRFRKAVIDDKGVPEVDSSGNPLHDEYVITHPRLMYGVARIEKAANSTPHPLLVPLMKVGRWITVGRTTYNPIFPLIDASRNIQTDFINLLAKDIRDGNNNKVNMRTIAKAYSKNAKAVLLTYPTFFKALSNKNFETDNELVGLYNQLVDDGFYSSFNDSIGVKDKASIIANKQSKNSTILGRLLTTKKIADDKATDTAITVDRKGRKADTIRTADAYLAAGLDKLGSVYLDGYVEFGNLASKVAGYKTLLDAGVGRQEAGAIIRRLYDPQNTGLAVSSLSALFPFLRSAITGADNTLQTLSTTRGAGLLLAHTAVFGAILVPLLAANFDDELGKFSILDLFKGIPVKSGVSDTGGKTSFLLPIGSGLTKIAWALSLYPELVKHHHESTVMAAYKNLFTQELAASPTFSQENSTGENFFMSFSPIALKPLARLTLNKNAFGGQIYNSNEVLGRPDSDNGKLETPQQYKDLAKDLYEITKGRVDLSPEVYRTLMQEYAVGALSYFYHANETYKDASQGLRVSKADQLGALAMGLGVGGVYTMEEQTRAESFYSQKNAVDTILKENKVEFSIKGNEEKVDERLKRVVIELTNNNTPQRDVNIVLAYLTAKNKLDKLNRGVKQVQVKNLEALSQGGDIPELEELLGQRKALLEQINSDILMTSQAPEGLNQPNEKLDNIEDNF
jgi:hypothetical protein